MHAHGAEEVTGAGVISIHTTTSYWICSPAKLPRTAQGGEKGEFFSGGVEEALEVAQSQR
jgi:hypothetical protein